MNARVPAKIMRWIIDHLLWDTKGATGGGFGRGLWAARKLLAAIVGAVLLTWWEWEEHHPPDIAIVALIHFVFVLVAIALVVLIGQWYSRGTQQPHSRRPNGPNDE